MLALAALTGPTLSSSMAAVPPKRTVVCPDGTVHYLSGDKVTEGMVFAETGSVSPSLMPNAADIKQGIGSAASLRPLRKTVATFPPEDTSAGSTSRPTR